PAMPHESRDRNSQQCGCGERGEVQGLAVQGADAGGVSMVEPALRLGCRASEASRSRGRLPAGRWPGTARGLEDVAQPQPAVLERGAACLHQPVDQRAEFGGHLECRQRVESRDWLALERADVDEHPGRGDVEERDLLAAAETEREYRVAGRG